VTESVRLTTTRCDGDVADLVEEGRTDFAPRWRSRCTSTRLATGSQRRSSRAGKSSFRGPVTASPGTRTRGGGVIVQTGRLPTYGDTEKDGELERYREVARSLRPICLDTHPPPGADEFGSVDPERSYRGRANRAQAAAESCSLFCQSGCRFSDLAAVGDRDRLYVLDTTPGMTFIC
jgi:hypothetical protein